MNEILEMAVNHWAKNNGYERYHPMGDLKIYWHRKDTEFIGVINYRHNDQVIAEFKETLKKL